MNVLVVNSGSTSLKYQLINTETHDVKVEGAIGAIGLPEGTSPTHKHAVKEMFAELKKSDCGENIDAIGHRVVHGGEKFKKNTLVTAETLEEVEKISHLAPLHNPANLMGVRACMEEMPDTPNVMVFDTSFHSDMPKKAYLYAIPTEDYEQHGIRRYGFHGTSHDCVSRKCAELYGKPRESLRIITCHLGGGCSVCAVDKGKSAETSMGMTPLEGLVMDSRSGDIDPAAVQFLSKAHNLDLAKTINYLNKECGLKGLSGHSADTRANMAARESNPRVQTAFDVYVHRLVKYIGGYTAVMGGVDAIAFTGGVGSNQKYIRECVMSHFEYLGADIDPAKNDYYSAPNLFQTGEISKKGARVRTFVIKTEEELEIARETCAIVGKRK